MSSKPSETCKINILDKDYVINCNPDEQKMLMKSVEFLNKRIKETRSSGTVTGGEKIMVMTALNIVYDYLSSENDNNQDTETEAEDNNQTTKKLIKINKKIEAALHQHQQIELA